MNADTTTLFSVRLSGAMTDTGQRLEIARIIAPKLKINGEQAEKLLGKTGNLLKPASLERASKFLEILEGAGASARLIELNADGGEAHVVAAEARPAPASQSGQGAHGVQASASMPSISVPSLSSPATPSAMQARLSDPFEASVRTLEQVVPPPAPQPQSSLDSFAALEAALGLSPQATTPAPVVEAPRAPSLDWPPAATSPRALAHTIDADVLDLSAYLTHDEDDDPWASGRTSQVSQAGIASQSSQDSHDEDTLGYAQGDPDAVWSAGPSEGDVDPPMPGTLTQLDIKKTYSATIEDRFGQKPQGWLSLRWKLLPLALLPTLALGLVWLFTTLTSQARAGEGLLLRGTAQTATLFSRQALTGIASSKDALSDPVVLSILQQNVTDFFKSKSLPLESVVVTDAQGKIRAVYSNSFSAVADQRTVLDDPVDSFSKLASESALAMQTMAPATAQYKPDGNTDALVQTPNGDNPVSRLVDADGTQQYLIGRPLEGGLGAVIMGVNADSIKGPVRGAVLSTLVILAATLLLVGVVASYFAERLAQRVRKLAHAADQISLGGLDEKIEPGGLDEIGDLAQAVDRMRFSLESAMRRMRRS